MQVSKYRKNIHNLSITQKTKNLLLSQTAKYGRKAANTSNLIIKSDQNMNKSQWKRKQQLQQIQNDNNQRISRKKFLKIVEDQKIEEIAEDRKQQLNSIKNQLQTSEKDYQKMYLSQVFKFLNFKKENIKSNPIYLSSSSEILSTRKTEVMTAKPTSNTKEDILKICLNCFIICSNIIKSRNLIQAEIILVHLDKTLSDIYSESENYMWKMMRVRIILLKTELIMAKLEFNCHVSKKQMDLVLRLPLFCRELQSDQKYYPILSEDYYSFIEIIYLNALNSFTLQNKSFKHFTNSMCLSEKRKPNFHLTTVNMIKNKRLIEQLIQNCRICLFKQLQKLCRILTEIGDKKIFRIITLKCEILLKLYGFQLAFIYIQDKYQNMKKNHPHQSSMDIKQNESEQSKKVDKKKQFLSLKTMNELKREQENLRVEIEKGKNKIWNKYENIFKIVPNSINKGQIEDKIFSLFKDNISDQFKENEINNQTLQKQGQSSNLFLYFHRDIQGNNTKNGQEQKSYSFLDEYDRNKQDQKLSQEISDLELYSIEQKEIQGRKNRLSSRRDEKNVNLAQNLLNFGQKCQTKIKNQILTINQEQEYLIHNQQCNEDPQVYKIKTSHNTKTCEVPKTTSYFAQQKVCSSQQVSLGKSKRQIKRKYEKNLLASSEHTNDKFYQKNQKGKRRFLSVQHSNKILKQADTQFQRPSLKIQQNLQEQDNNYFFTTSHHLKPTRDKLSLKNELESVPKKSKKVLIVSKLPESYTHMDELEEIDISKKSQKAEKRKENLLKDMNKILSNTEQKQKTYLRNQSEQVMRGESIGKRIYKMDIFKMALAATPMRQTMFPNLQVHRQKQLISTNISLSPEVRKKKSKSLNNNCQKYVTFIPGLINIPQKKKENKKLTLNR